MLGRLAGIWHDAAGEVFVVAAEAGGLHPHTRDVMRIAADGQQQVWRGAVRWEPSNGCVYAVKETSRGHVALVGDGRCLDWLPLHAGERRCSWQRLPGRGLPLQAAASMPAGAGPALRPSVYAAQAGA